MSTLRERLAVTVIFLLVVSNMTAAGLLQVQVDSLETELEGAQEQNDVYRHDASVTNGTPASPVGQYAQNHSVDAPMLVYAPSIQSGEVTTLHVSSVPGSGTYLNVDNVTYLQASQESVVPVKTYIQESPSYTLPHDAVFVSIERGSSWRTINGDSFQLPLTLALLATNPDVSLNSSVIATGAIGADGSVQAVGRVDEKAVAAREAGYSVLLVPPDRSVTVDGIRVQEVETVEEAVEIALTESD